MRRPEDFDPNPEIDTRLRSLLDPRPGAAERIARLALEPPPAHSPRRIAATALAGALLLLFLLLLPLRTGRPPIPEETGRISITNVGGVVTVTTPSGEGSVIRSGGSGPDSGSQIIISMRETK